MATGCWYFDHLRNTTVKFRTFGLAAAIAVLAPVICKASPETSALNACARAFASSLASPGTAAPAFKVVYGDSGNATTAIVFFERDYAFDLYANNRKSGLLIARAHCSSDVRGSVVSLSLIPLDKAAQAGLAARN